MPKEVPHPSRRKVATTKVTTHAAGFMGFIREQGIVGLAVGLAVGTQAAVLVAQIVGSVVTPVIDLLVGKGGLEGLKWTVHIADRTGVFTFGKLIDVTIRFLAIVFVIYIVVRVMRLDKLDKKRDLG